MKARKQGHKLQQLPIIVQKKRVLALSTLPNEVLIICPTLAVFYRLLMIGLPQYWQLFGRDIHTQSSCHVELDLEIMIMVEIG